MAFTPDTQKCYDLYTKACENENTEAVEPEEFFRKVFAAAYHLLSSIIESDTPNFLKFKIDDYIYALLVPYQKGFIGLEFNREELITERVNDLLSHKDSDTDPTELF